MIEVDGKAVLYHGDCLEVLKTLPDCSVDSIVCDPPAGIAFMGKEWDKDKGGRDAWIAWMQSVARECLRVVKHGGHALVWALPRTSHWTGMAWENAGWEPRDKIVHLFGTGFPKSLDVSKAIDKAAGAKREVVGYSRGVGVEDNQGYGGIARGGVGIVQKGIDVPVTAPATDAAKQWEGWGTALKPASEDWWLMRKPLIGTVAANVLAHGTGAINVDECRVGSEGGTARDGKADKPNDVGWQNMRGHGIAKLNSGRWPANFIHDGSAEVLAGFPHLHGSGNKSDIGTGKDKGYKASNFEISYSGRANRDYGSIGGSAARFFYCAKASVKDREEGLDDLPYGTLAYSNGAQAAESDGADEYTGGSTDIGLNNIKKRKNTHPTVKHTELMRYLCRLVTPPNGVVLDPFMGSGSTGKACMLEKFRFIGIEMEAQYLKIAEARIHYAAIGKTLKANPEPEDTAKAQPDDAANPVQASLFDIE